MRYIHPYAGKVKRSKEERAAVIDETAHRIGYVVRKLRLRRQLAANVGTVTGNGAWLIKAALCIFRTEGRGNGIKGEV